jgi:hypothetical protein
VNDFVTIFEISSDANGAHWDYLFQIAIGVGVMVGTCFLVRHLWRTAGTRLVGWIMPFFMMVWAVFWLWSHVPWFLKSMEHTSSLIQLYRSGRASIVEGPVKVLRIQPHHGHTGGDRIMVGDKEFEINFFRQTPGYMTSIEHDGALQAGVYARLTYHEGVILKVEVKK